MSFIPLAQWPDGSQMGRVVGEHRDLVNPNQLRFVYNGPDGQMRFEFLLEQPAAYTKELSREFGKDGKLIPLGKPSCPLLRDRVRVSRSFRERGKSLDQEKWRRLIWFLFDYLGLNYTDMRRESRIYLGIPFVEPHFYEALVTDAELNAELKLLLDPAVSQRRGRKFHDRLGELVRIDSPHRKNTDMGTFTPKRERTQWRHGTELGSYEEPRQIMTGDREVMHVRFPLRDRSRFRLIVRKPWRKCGLSPADKEAAERMSPLWSAELHEQDETQSYVRCFKTPEYPTFFELVDAHWYMMPGLEDVHPVDHWLDRHGLPGVSAGDVKLQEAWELLMGVPVGLLSNPDMVKYAASLEYL